MQPRLLFVALLATSCTETEPTLGSPGRLVVLGFDGVGPSDLATGDPGRLRNLRALSELNLTSALATTTPPASIVAWTTFSTGLKPEAHGVRDVIERREDYSLRVGGRRIERGSIRGGQVIAPVVTSTRRRGRFFWDVVLEAGVSARVHNVPYAYPLGDRGQILAGVGLPDIRGSTSSFTLLTTEVEEAARTDLAGGRAVLLEKTAKGRWRGDLPGPRLLIDGVDQTLTAGLEIVALGRHLIFFVGSHQLRVAINRDSPPLEIGFVHESGASVRALTRVRVLATRPPRVYVAPLGSHPNDPYFAISSVPEMARRLYADIGPFPTVGWAHDTNAAAAGVISQRILIDRAVELMQWRGRALFDALDHGREKLVVAVFTATDRVAHFAFPADRQPVLYEMDQIVGGVLDRLSRHDTLIVMSDHCMQQFRWQVDLNRWLVDAGYLVIEDGVVDWSKTRAHAAGTGVVSLNLAGRDAQGIVESERAGALAGEIAAGLQRMTDGEIAPIREVVRQGHDLRVTFADGYRVSWATARGEVGSRLFDANEKHWRYDHVSAHSADVPGILVTNRPIAVDHPAIEDIPATVYDLLGVKPPYPLAGRPLFERR